MKPRRKLAWVLAPLVLLATCGAALQLGTLLDPSAGRTRGLLLIE